MKICIYEKGHSRIEAVGFYVEGVFAYCDSVLKQPEPLEPFQMYAEALRVNRKRASTIYEANVAWGRLSRDERSVKKAHCEGCALK